LVVFALEKNLLSENLKSLHQEEARLRAITLEFIDENQKLEFELDVIHQCLDHLFAIVNGHVHRNEDELTIQRLGIRLFNAGASSLKAAFSGYYQIALLIVRDVNEILNLLDLFGLEKNRISDWCTADDTKRFREYTPLKVRKALESHPGYEGQEAGRARIYKQLSTYAAHASNNGFRLLGGADLQSNIGPFFDEPLLRAYLEETATQLTHAGLLFSMLFSDETEHLIREKQKFVSQLEKWKVSREQKPT